MTTTIAEQVTNLDWDTTLRIAQYSVVRVSAKKVLLCNVDTDVRHYVTTEIAAEVLSELVA